MTDDNDRPFVRWQSRTIEQLSYANNLFIALGAGGLAYTSDLLIESRAEVGSVGFCLVAVAAGALFLSLLFGLVCVFTRLNDFRTTAEIARCREKEASSEHIASLQANSKAFGRVTWFCFWFEVSAFGIAAIVLAFAVWARVSNATAV